MTPVGQHSQPRPKTNEFQRYGATISIKGSTKCDHLLPRTKETHLHFDRNIPGHHAWLHARKHSKNVQALHSQSCFPPTCQFSRHANDQPVDFVLHLHLKGEDYDSILHVLAVHVHSASTALPKARAKHTSLGSLVVLGTW